MWKLWRKKSKICDAICGKGHFCAELNFLLCPKIREKAWLYKVPCIDAKRSNRPFCAIYLCIQRALWRDSELQYNFNKRDTFAHHKIYSVFFYNFLRNGPLEKKLTTASCLALKNIIKSCFALLKKNRIKMFYASF